MFKPTHFLVTELSVFSSWKKMHSTLFKSGDNPKFMQNTELQIWLYGLRGEKQDDQRELNILSGTLIHIFWKLRNFYGHLNLEPGYEIKDGLSYVCNGFEVIKYMKISGNFVRVYNVLTQTRTEQSLVFRLSSTHHA